MSYFLMYLIVMLDDAVVFFGVMSFVLSVISFCVTCHNIEKGITVPRFIRYTAAISVVFAILTTFTPNTKQAAVIVVVPTIINKVQESEEINKIPEELASLANEWMRELKPKKGVVK